MWYATQDTIRICPGVFPLEYNMSRYTGLQEKQFIIECNIRQIAAQWQMTLNVWFILGTDKGLRNEVMELRVAIIINSDINR